MAEFTEIGRHCAAENCNQQDFLPFKCDCCDGTFCLPHRSYVGHGCASSGDKDFRALVCPLCKKTVRFAGSQDPNEQWDLHTRTDCNPGDYKKNKPSKKRCSAPSCRELLGPTNTQRCARCGKETCLTHRFPDSHNCSSGGSSSGGGSWSSRGDARSSAAAAAARRMQAQANQARPMSLREKAALKRASTSNQQSASANTARATADRRRRINPGAAATATATAAQTLGFGGGSGGGGTGGGQGEQCPQCGASYGDVGSLVAHVEAFHSEERQGQFRAAGSGGSSTGEGERCLICNSHFADVALLVSHAETAHPDGSGSAGAGAGGASNCSIS